MTDDQALPGDAVDLGAQAIIAIADDFGHGQMVAIDYVKAARAAIAAAAPALRDQGAATERERIRKFTAEIASMCPGCDAFRAFFEDLDGTP